jgi:hypothetical protein
LPILFGLAILVGAALLFVIEPMFARRILPQFGGSPAVWNTCMVFYQAALLGGYAYVHGMTSRIGVRRQAVVHLVLLGAALWVVWTRVPDGAPRLASPTASTANPTGELFGLMLTTVGLPFFVLAATAPLLQRWFAASGHPAAGDPYFLYGASNLGGLIGLLAYPLAIEPYWPLDRQDTLWAIGYLVLAALTLGCAAAAWRGARAAAPTADRDRPGRWSILRWTALAFVPSSLLLGVTTFLTTDLAPVPLLWILPLFLYLMSFVLVFARRPVVPHALMVSVLPMGVLVLVPLLIAGLVQSIWIPVHLLTFFVASMVGHGELARLRPAASELTVYYLAIAAGGVLGGIFNALVAPVVFDRVVEYPLGVFLACLCLPGIGPDATGRGLPREALVPLILGVLVAGLVRDVGGVAESALGPVAVMLASGLAVLVAVTARRRPLRFALGVGALLLAGGLSDGVDGRVLHRERTFFGVLRVTEVVDDEGCLHRLFHGNTLHGQQRLAPRWRCEPLAYYHRSGPAGQVFEALHARPGLRLRAAVVGLGAGSLAAYARPGESWTFYEIDPAVVRIARDPSWFTFLRDSRAATLDVVAGDARLQLHAAAEQAADLIVLDAFSSDAVPMHLLTREALQLYRANLAGGGLIALHLSNRMIDLEPVVGQLARDAGLVARVRRDRVLSAEERRAGKSPSIWAVLAGQPGDLGALAADPRWEAPRLVPGDRVWTDDYSSILGHLAPGSWLSLR